MKLLGLRNWTEPIRRQICIVDNRETNLADYGMIVDTSGVYFHNEGAHILAGYSPPDEPPGYHFNYDGERFFLNEIWPRLYRADVLDGASAPRHRMGRAVRGQRPTAARSSGAPRHPVSTRRIRSAAAA